jgi:hypothetical protein
MEVVEGMLSMELTDAVDG